MTINTILIILILSLIPVVLSYVVEALRKSPQEPKKLSWSNDIAIRHIDVSGVNLRYIKAGQGEPLLLLHTLRTQLDMFQKLVPLLSEKFTVYAVDYPGHGYSDIPNTEYTPQYFLKSVEGFLDGLDLHNVTVAGESIGGTLGLMLAAKQNTRIKKIISINPYDYGKGLGVARGSWIGKVLFYMNNIPLLGATNWRLRVYPAFLHIMRGGVVNSDVLPDELMHEIDDVGNRPSHYRSFMSLIRNFPKWEDSKQDYHEIQVPVVLIYGEHDWSSVEERFDTKRRIHNSTLETIPDAGHFLSLENPGHLMQIIKKFAGNDIDDKQPVSTITTDTEISA